MWIFTPITTIIWGLSWKKSCQGFNLFQVVGKATHSSHLGQPSTIDLALISSLSFPLNCETLPPLGSSDRHMVSLDLCIKADQHTMRCIWQYSLADYNLMNSLILSTQWDMLFTEDVKWSWIAWKHTFLAIMQHCIPHKYVKVVHMQRFLSQSLSYCTKQAYSTSQDN